MNLLEECFNRDHIQFILAIILPIIIITTILIPFGIFKKL